MEEIFPSDLIDLLSISVALSFVLMVFLQKIKALPFIKQAWQIWLINFLCSFIIGIPFGMRFYNLNPSDSVWIAIFSFIGAPAIFDILKNQTIITYRPKSLSDYIEVPKENLIER